MNKILLLEDFEKAIMLPVIKFVEIFQKNAYYENQNFRSDLLF